MNIGSFSGNTLFRRGSCSGDLKLEVQQCGKILLHFEFEITTTSSLR